MRFAELTAIGCWASIGACESVLLSGGTIIAFVDDTQALDVIRNGALLLTDDRVAGIYHDVKPAGLPSDTEIVDCTNKIISPGFIDTHRHGWQTAMRTVASNTTLAEYLARYAGQHAAAIYTPEDIYLGQLAGLLEALNAGVTTTLDHAHHIWSKDHAKAGLDASIESGARVYWNHAFGTFSGYSIQDQITDFKSWRKAATNTLTTVAAAFDMWKAETTKDVQAVIDIIKKLSIPVLTTHWLGSVWLFDNSPELLHSWDILNTSTAVVFSHGTSINPGAALLLRQTNQFISITPESEMAYGHSHFDNHHVQDQSALGVDTHFIFSTDMVTQARIWLQRTRSRLFDEVIKRWEIPINNPMSVNQAFLLATRNGALALRRPDLGVLQVGAKADLVVFDGRSPGMLGWDDPVAAIILHSNVGDIEHVMVDGKFRKRNGKLVFDDYDSVVDRFLASTKRIQKGIRQQPKPALEGNWLGVGCPYGHAAQVNAHPGSSSGTGYGAQFL
ncbi:hypothetical protein F5Y15DRAFT_387076 [Xylariaceae sp. FL0016]|nr:hypothetical protein F5Y15DRAFT_387076 [Xylariaceae sp. FL0016]